MREMPISSAVTVFYTATPVLRFTCRYDTHIMPLVRCRKPQSLFHLFLNHPHTLAGAARCLHRGVSRTAAISALQVKRIQRLLGLTAAYSIIASDIVCGGLVKNYNYTIYEQQESRRTGMTPARQTLISSQQP
jgi:hypothetical protein